MPITVTWDDGVDAPTTFTMPDDVIASIESFRQTITGSGSLTPTYPTVQALIVGMMVQNVVLPALRNFPTASIQAAQANLASAQAAFIAAQAAAIPGFGGGNG